MFLFSGDDKRSPEERLKTAAAAYLSGGEEPELLRAPSREAGEGWEVARGERGKPYFPKRPELGFSISHTGPLWACAFHRGPVGLDIQEHTRFRGEDWAAADERLGRLAVRFFHKKEAAYVGGRHERFFQIWAAKESYVKYTGRGIDEGFGEFSVLPSDLGERLPESWEALGVRFHETALSHGFTVCVCMERGAGCALYTCTGPAFRRQSIF